MVRTGMTSTPQDEAQPKARGRPRARETDESIFRAVWSGLANVGFEGLTFEAVAAAAGCSRATLYRRFSSRFELVAATVNEVLHSLEPTLPENHSARQNLILHAKACAELMSGERGRALMSISEAGTRYPELIQLMERREQRAKDFVYAEFRRLRPTGLTAERLAFAFDTLIGSVIYQVTLRNRTLSQRQLETLVDCAIAIVRDETSTFASSATSR